MAPPKSTKKPAAGKKEKLFHPLSRKADQLVREQHRKSKLVGLSKSRTRKQEVQVDLYSFFYAAIPAEGVLTLADLHTIIRNVWLPRYDAELETERKARRKGRPKSVKEQKIEELKLRESEEYRTGLEVIDLTDLENVKLFRQWDHKEPAYIGQLRFIRISSATPDVCTLAKPGLHPLLKRSTDHPPESQQQEEAMDEDEAPLLLEPTDRFSSTIMGMDEIPS